MNRTSDLAYTLSSWNHSKLSSFHLRGNPLFRVLSPRGKNLTLLFRTLPGIRFRVEGPSTTSLVYHLSCVGHFKHVDIILFDYSSLIRSLLSIV